MFSQNVRDIYFDFDTAEIRPDQQTAIERDAALAQHPDIGLTVEGNCDERGSTEYNLALGDKRANAVKEMLVAGGVSSASIKTMSYGKENPVCTEQDEICWQQNRHDHLSPLAIARKRGAVGVCGPRFLLRSAQSAQGDQQASVGAEPSFSDIQMKSYSR